MALSAPFKSFGIHSITPYNRENFVPYGILKILGDAQFDFSGDAEDLFGGSNKYAWASEQKTLNAELSCSVKCFDDFILDLCLGTSTTANAAETTGNVSTITNKKGTSVVSATTGIASVAATGSDEADLKTGFYVVQASAAAKVLIKCMSDVDFTKGTNAVYNADSLAIVAELTLSGSGATHALADFGITFTCGSSATSLTIGDTAYFWVRKVNTGSSIITVGASTQEFVEFGILAYGQKRSNGDILELWAPRCVATGMPIKMGEKAWSVSDFKIKMMYDDTENCIAKIRKILA